MTTTKGIGMGRGVLAGAATLGLMLSVGGCSKSGGDASRDIKGPGIALTVGALNLEGVGDASYAVTITNGGGDVVWTRSGITSGQFGDGAGDITYVGSCDASANPNTIALTLESLSRASGSVIDPGTYVNPGTLTQTVDCLENQDVPVTFNIAIVRDAQQGFFDVAVNFSDIFCSAKVDCVDADGDPITLLHNPDSGDREQTMVMALACTSGQGQETFLHMNDIFIECDEGRYWSNPANGPGNMGGQDPMLFQTAAYRGREDLPGLDKCYWNTAFGLDMAALGTNCKLIASATAAEAELVDGMTPPNTVYPYIEYNVPITNSSGALVCGAHPLNGADGFVKTSYTPIEGKKFTYAMDCGETTITTQNRTLCQGNVVGQTEPAAIETSPVGVTVALGDRVSANYTLPDGMQVEGCCANPCCAEIP